VSRNLLIDLMPPSVAEDLMGIGAPFEVPFGQQVESELVSGSHVFIVTEGIASKFQRSDSGRVSEVAIVGHEGMFPLSVLLGVPAAAHIVVAHIGPLAGRVVRARDFQAIVQDSPDAAALIRRYCYAFFGQISSNLINDHNPITARVARALLMCHDRVPGDELLLTHDTLAQMTFAHRPTISNVLHEMRERGVIDTGRGHLLIRRRDELSRMADGSYGISERYWNAHIGPFGKDEPPPAMARVA
jgi:CRP-like cAMP-binding protein